MTRQQFIHLARLGFRITLGVLILLLLWGIGWVFAADVVCGDATKMTRYLASVDASTVQDATCSKIPKDQTPAQRELVQQYPEYFDGEFVHLKVEGGLAVQRTPEEEQPIQAKMAAQAQAAQNYQDETVNNNFCDTASLQAVDSRIIAARNSLQAKIDQVGNINQAKTAMTEINNTYAQASRQLARCMIARRYVRCRKDTVCDEYAYRWR